MHYAAPNSRAMQIFIKPNVLLVIITMFREFCTLTRWKIHQWGVTLKKAAHYMVFFFFDMMIVCALMGALRVPSDVKNHLTRGFVELSSSVRTPLFSRSPFFALRH